MKSETVRDRLLQVAGLVVLIGLTVAFLFAFRENLLPQQEEGDVFGTVYAMPSEDTSEREAESASASVSDASSAATESE